MPWLLVIQIALWIASYVWVGLLPFWLVWLPTLLVLFYVVVFLGIVWLIGWARTTTGRRFRTR